MNRVETEEHIMKKNISLMAMVSLLIVTVLSLAGCGSSEKFAGYWVGEVGYNQDYFHFDYNKIGMETLHIEKNGSSNSYSITDRYSLWGVKDKEQERPAFKMVATNPKDSNMLHVAQQSLTFTYNEKDGKLHLTGNDGSEAVFVKVKDEKAIEAIKDRIAKFVDEHMDEMKQIQSAHDISFGWEKGPNVTKQQEEDAVNMKKALAEEVQKTDFTK